MQSSSPTPKHYAKESKAGTQTDTRVPVSTAAFAIPKGRGGKRPSVHQQVKGGHRTMEYHSVTKGRNSDTRCNADES